MGADLPRGRGAALILVVGLVACSADDVAPADAAPSADAGPVARCRVEGCSWHAVVSGTTDTILTFVAGADGKLRAATTDGGVWIAPAGDGFAPLDGERPPLTSYVERAGGLALGTVTGETTIRLSRDGGNVFTAQETGATAPLAQVIDAFGTFVAPGGSPLQIWLWSGADGMSWSKAEVPLTPGSSVLAATIAMTPGAPFVTIAVGQSLGSALILRSINFSGGWSTQSMAMSAPTLRGVAWNRRIPGILVAVGDGGTVMRSEDGVVWSKVTSGTTSGLDAVAAVGPLFVAAGHGGTVLISEDGASWTVLGAGSDDLRAVGSDGVHAYVAGAHGALFRSDPL